MDRGRALDPLFERGGREEHFFHGQGQRVLAPRALLVGAVVEGAGLVHDRLRIERGDGPSRQDLPGRDGRGGDEGKEIRDLLAGQAAFFMFLYLEVLDASFSFDGVIGAFAITNDIVLMALGLGVGAMYVRSLTVYLVRQGTLDDYVYLEHGAHYAIGALAVILLVTIQYEIHEVITGLVGVVLIAWSFWSSVRRNRRLEAAGGEGGESAEVTARV